MRFDFSQMRNNQHFTLIMGGIVIAIIIGAIVSFYRWARNKTQNEPFLIKKKRRGDRIERKNKKTGQIEVLPAYQVFGAKTIKPSKLGADYSYSFWIKVDDWDYNYGKPKHIFHKGDRGAFSVNPGVWLYPRDNNIMIRVDNFDRKNNVSMGISGRTCQYWTAQYPHKHDTYPGNPKYAGKDLGDHNFCRNPDNSEAAWCYTSDAKKKREFCGFKDHREAPSMNPLEGGKEQYDIKKQCDLVNFPVQRWVHIVLVMHNRTLDVFVNGKLARSCTFDGVPKDNKGQVHITDNGGFKGELGEFKYVNRALSPDEIYWIYRRGYQTFTLYDKVAKIEPPKVNLQLDASISVGDNDASFSGEIDTY